MKKIIVLAVIAAMMAIAWIVFFGAGPNYSEFAAIESKYKQPDELAPSNLEAIKEYKQDMLFLKRKYSFSPEASLLADIRIDLAEMEENLILLGNEFAKIDRRNVDCGEGSRISKVEALHAAAKKKAIEASSNSQKLETNYSAFAESAGISSQEYKQSIEGASGSIENIGNIISSYC